LEVTEKKWWKVPHTYIPDGWYMMKETARKNSVPEDCGSEQHPIVLGATLLPECTMPQAEGHGSLDF
jgi:hypothetical protein